MRGKDLLEKLSLTSSEYVQAADKKPKSKKKIIRIMSIGMTAACIAVVGGVILHISNSNVNVEIDVPQKQISTTSSDKPQNKPQSNGLSASDKYNSLEELLQYLDKNEKHSNEDLKGVESLSIKGDSLDKGSQTVMYQDYLYHYNPYADDNGNYIKIFSLKSQDSDPVSEVQLKNDSLISAVSLFIYGDELIVAQSYGMSMDNNYIAVAIYSLSRPESPKLENEYIQNGVYDMCCISDGKFYVFTSDGVCACGFSEKSDLSEYIPSSSMDGKNITWSDDDITILGEPERVYYTAIGVINLETKALSDKRAVYGDIQNIFFGDNTMICYVQSSSDNYDKPEIYLFDMSENIPYTGKINIDTSGVTEILDIKKYGDTYRIIGQTYNGIGNLWTSEILAVSADTKTGNYDAEKYKLDNANDCIDDIVWNEDNAIMTIGEQKITGVQVTEKAKFVFAEFDSTKITFKESGLTADRVTGIEGIHYSSSPLGFVKSMIPLGNGIYIRYNGRPNGLDIYDFSDTENPKCIYQSVEDVPANYRFDTDYAVYENGTLGIMVIIPNSYGQYRNAEVHFCVYAVDPKNTKPFTLLKEYPIDREEYSFGGISGEWKIFEYNGKSCYVNPETHQLAFLK